MNKRNIYLGLVLLIISAIAAYYASHPLFDFYRSVLFPSGITLQATGLLEPFLFLYKISISLGLTIFFVLCTIVYAKKFSVLKRIVISIVPVLSVSGFVLVIKQQQVIEYLNIMTTHGGNIGQVGIDIESIAMPMILGWGLIAGLLVLFVSLKTNRARKGSE